MGTKKTRIRRPYPYTGDPVCDQLFAQLLARLMKIGKLQLMDAIHDACTRTQAPEKTEAPACTPLSPEIGG